ncbi:MAG: hypothetical protein K1000chlam2_01718 [Chlamydiae bacterium]|nr:hypothetical protein [Chlamydiota bacterium]
MRINPTKIPSAVPLSFGSSIRFDPALSTFSKMRECAKKKKPDFFVWIFQKIWTWFQSWFKKPEPKSTTIEFFKVGGSNGSVKYRLIRNGKKTDNEVELAKQAVILEGITFSGEMQSHLPEMLQEVMKNEKMDAVKTVNFSLAKRLWMCGLKTDNEISLSSRNKEVVAVLKQAIENKESLQSKALQSLERVETAIARDHKTGTLDKTKIERIFSSTEVVKFTIPLQDLFVLMESTKISVTSMLIPAVTFTK